MMLHLVEETDNIAIQITKYFSHKFCYVLKMSRTVNPCFHLLCFWHIWHISMIHLPMFSVSNHMDALQYYANYFHHQVNALATFLISYLGISCCRSNFYPQINVLFSSTSKVCKQDNDPKVNSKAPELTFRSTEKDKLCGFSLHSPTGLSIGSSQTV